MATQKFIVEPHFRLQEWVAEEKGYFKDEGLDYIFQELIRSTDGKHHDRGDRIGAMQSFERGREAAVSCACHWTVGVAASKGKGRLYADLYSVAPSGVFVPPESPIKTPEDLAGVPIAVGYQSGSHYSTIQALEQYMPLSNINLTFADGMLFARLDQLLGGNAQAFDERFDFHFYDLDLCRQAEQHGVRMGTIPLGIIHESGGQFGTPPWKESYHRYLAKWGE